MSENEVTRALEILGDTEELDRDLEGYVGVQTGLIFGRIRQKDLRDRGGAM